MWSFNSRSRKICSPIDFRSVSKEPLHAGFCQSEWMNVRGSVCRDHRARCSGCSQGITHHAPRAWGFSFAPETSDTPMTQVANRALVHCHEPPWKSLSVLGHNLVVCLHRAKATGALFGCELTIVSWWQRGAGCLCYCCLGFGLVGNAPSRTEHVSVVRIHLIRFLFYYFFFPFWFLGR